MRITNHSGVPLPIAVWLLHDDYDYINEPNYISVTSLMKPIRHLIIPPRLSPTEITPPDVVEYVARARGHALHDSMEKAWTKDPQRKLRLLGYPEQVIQRLMVNPTDEERMAAEDPILVYTEQRAFREFMGYTIGGKFDMVADGVVQDTKSTSVFSWLSGTRDEDYRIQMSMYRWLDAEREKQGLPRRITEDFGRVNFIFTDWSKAMARSNPAYPKQVEDKEIWLMSLEETEDWVRNRINLIQKYRDQPEHLLPECTEEELWRSAPKYKYYVDPTKATDPKARSTKNFETLGEAHQFQAEKGKGVVITVPGEVKRCDYCAAFEGCTQKDRYYS